LVYQEKIKVKYWRAPKNRKVIEPNHRTYKLLHIPIDNEDAEVSLFPPLLFQQNYAFKDKTSSQLKAYGLWAQKKIATVDYNEKENCYAPN